MEHILLRVHFIVGNGDPAADIPDTIEKPERGAAYKPLRVGRQ